MSVSDFYNARWPDFICISAHYKYLMMMMMMMKGDRSMLNQSYLCTYLHTLS